jgi:arylsulfatase
MNRRKIKLCTCLVVLGSAWIELFSVLAVEAKPLAGGRPNIILVMTDDQGYGDLGCHGHPFLKTPNLDKLHEQSIRFVDFHASPTCAPTRAALMSGRDPFKCGVTHTILERERMALGIPTVAEMLKGAGYVTGIFGKWHLGDADPYQPQNRGFDEVFIHGAGGIGQNYPGTQGAVPGTGYFDPIIKHNNTFVQTKGYCTDVFFRQTLGWIKANKDRPFFAYLATNAPHGPFIVADQYKAAFKDKTDDDKVASFLGMIVNVDENMGLLMEKLDEWGLAENTLLIFMTDNGSAKGWKIHNAGMKGGKGSVNQGGSRVPLFMRWPGKITPGVDVNRLTRHYDLFPTLADLAGATLPSDIILDGRSLISLIENPSADWSDRHTVFHKGRWSKAGAGKRWGKGNTDPDGAKYKGFAVRNARWRLVERDNLYDIENDPGEKRNVIAQHPEVAEQMLKRFDSWWTEVRPLMVNEDAPLEVGKPFIELYERQMKTGGLQTWEPPSL